MALFAEHVLKARDFFSHPRARKLGDVGRVLREGRRFNLGDCSFDVLDQCVTWSKTVLLGGKSLGRFSHWHWVLVR